MKTLFNFLWIVIAIVAIGWAALPFILASALELAWINWFGILTVPTGIGGVVMVLIQRRMFRNADF